MTRDASFVRRNVAALLLSGAVGAGVAPAQQPGAPDTRSPRERAPIDLSGQWVAVVVFRDGSTVKTVAYGLTLDATKSPAVLDMTFTQKEESGAVTSYGRKGVAELKGDRLTVVYTIGKDRPTSIDGRLGRSEQRWVLERKKR